MSASFTIHCFCILILLSTTTFWISGGQETCPVAPEHDTCGPGSRSQLFLLYRVRPGEGFNLCRDVYMRMAEVAVFLRQKGLNVTLVLPEWGPLPHWRNDAANMHMSWSKFFHVPSLNLLTPVIEMSDFVASISAGTEIELQLNHFPDTFSPDSKWTERYQIRDCDAGVHHSDDDDDDEHQGEDSASDCPDCSVSWKRKCVLLDGTTLTLANLILQNFSSYHSVLITNADVVLHENYGSAFFWQIRRSMRFTDYLIQKGNHFRSAFLQSDDDRDGTRMESDWRLMRRQAGHATGGQFVALHWRRSDFVQYRTDVPDIQCTAEQVIRIFSTVVAKDIRRLFLATDATKQEIDRLLGHLQKADIKVYMFEDNDSDPLPEGQRAVIDQWICAHSHFFLGEKFFSHADSFLSRHKTAGNTILRHSHMPVVLFLDSVSYSGGSLFSFPECRFLRLDVQLSHSGGAPNIRLLA
jgi:peptide-O-fucosyltransferase